MDPIHPHMASTTLLAREMVRIEDRMRNSRRLGYVDQAATMERYRGSVRDYRSALLRGEPVPLMTICPACRYLIEQSVWDDGSRCPWCDESLVRDLDRRTHVRT